MEDQEKMFEYDDEAAIAFIRNYLPQELKEKFQEDTIYYLLDTVCDFFEKKDFLNDEDEMEKEEKELADYLLSQIKKDNIGDFTFDEIVLFLKAEDAYSDTLDIFD
jgi:hypothetical protein